MRIYDRRKKKVVHAPGCTIVFEGYTPEEVKALIYKWAEAESALHEQPPSQVVKTEDLIDD